MQVSLFASVVTNMSAAFNHQTDKQVRTSYCPLALNTLYTITVGKQVTIRKQTFS